MTQHFPVWDQAVVYYGRQTANHQPLLWTYKRQNTLSVAVNQSISTHPSGNRAKVEHLNESQNVNLITQDPCGGAMLLGPARGGAACMFTSLVWPWFPGRSAVWVYCGPVSQHLEQRAYVCSLALAPCATGCRSQWSHNVLPQCCIRTHMFLLVTESQPQNKEWIYQYCCNQLQLKTLIKQKGVQLGAEIVICFETCIYIEIWVNSWASF